MIKRTRRFRCDNNAALEGLPLYLLILVVIAAVGIAIVLGWMSTIGTGPKTIKSIDLNPPQITVSPTSLTQKATNDTATVTITVYDQDNNKLGGALVTLSGCNVTKSALTADGGMVTISLASVELPPGQQTGTINVKVEKSGYSSYETSILVYRA